MIALRLVLTVWGGALAARSAVALGGAPTQFTCRLLVDRAAEAVFHCALPGAANRICKDSMFLVCADPSGRNMASWAA